MRRRAFLVGAGAAAVLAACSGDDDVPEAIPTATTEPGPGAGTDDAVLLRTGAALSLAAAAIYARRDDEIGDAAVAAHTAHAQLLDPSVTEPHPAAAGAWLAAADAELAIAATFQAWAAVASTPALRQDLMRAGASAARLYTAARAGELGIPPLPEAFQLTDPAVPDSWLLATGA